MKNNLKYNRGFIVPLVIAIIAVLIIGGAGSYYYKKGKSAQVTEVNDQSAASATLTVGVNTPTNIVSSSSTPALQPAITILSPKGGETFNVGQQVVIKWQDKIKLPSVNIVLLTTTADKCSEYTTNGSMGTCRRYEIYTGPDTGSFTWTVPVYQDGNPEYPDVGKYLIRIWPGAPESVRAFGHEGYNVDSYSNYFTIANPVSASNQPMITVTPTSGPVGTPVTVSVINSVPVVNGDIYLGGNPIQSTNGQFPVNGTQFTFNVPQQTYSGCPSLSPQPNVSVDCDPALVPLPSGVYPVYVKMYSSVKNSLGTVVTGPTTVSNKVNFTVTN